MPNSIYIKNFGPIDDANIELSNMTVLIGPNSSGKSFTALLIHALLNPLGEKGKNFSNEIMDLSFNSFVELHKNNSSTYVEFYEGLMKHIENSPNNKISFKISKSKFKTLIDEGVGLVYKNLIEEKLKQLFEVDNLDDLINSNSNFFEIKFNDMTLIKEKGKELTINLFTKNSLSMLISYDENNIQTDNFYRIESNLDDYEIYLNFLLLEEDGKLDLNKLIRIFYQFIARSLFEKLFKDYSYYIPSSRDELLKNKNSYLSQNLRGRFSFSSIQKELASNLLDIDPNSKNGDFLDVANNLENDIINGIVDMEYSEPNMDLYFKNTDNSINLPFNLTSSAIRELSPFILYMKYILKKGDTLVIEEPEAHLHPGNQRKLVKYFVEALNKGLNIIITTHSDYISDQINNNIRLGNISINTLDEEFDDYNKYHILDFKKINIYVYKALALFDFKTSKIDINNTGFIEDNFSTIGSELYDETIKLINSKEG